jgi:hypothetical protein
VPNITHITEIKRRKMGRVRNVAFMTRKLAKQPLGRSRQRLDDTNKKEFNLLKPTGYVMHQQCTNSRIVCSAHTAFKSFVFT